MNELRLEKERIRTWLEKRGVLGDQDKFSESDVLEALKLFFKSFYEEKKAFPSELVSSSLSHGPVSSPVPTPSEPKVSRLRNIWGAIKTGNVSQAARGIAQAGKEVVKTGKEKLEKYKLTIARNKFLEARSEIWRDDFFIWTVQLQLPEHLRTLEGRENDPTLKVVVNRQFVKTWDYQGNREHEIVSASYDPQSIVTVQEIISADASMFVNVLKCFWRKEPNAFQELARENLCIAQREAEEKRQAEEKIAVEKAAAEKAEAKRLVVIEAHPAQSSRSPDLEKSAVLDRYFRRGDVPNSWSDHSVPVYNQQPVSTSLGLTKQTDNEVQTPAAARLNPANLLNAVESPYVVDLPDQPVRVVPEPQLSHQSQSDAMQPPSFFQRAKENPVRVVKGSAAAWLLLFCAPMLLVAAIFIWPVIIGLIVEHKRLSPAKRSEQSGDATQKLSPPELSS